MARMSEEDNLCLRCQGFSSFFDGLLHETDPPEFMGEDYGEEKALVILELEAVLVEKDCRLCRLVRACIEELAISQLGENECYQVRLLRKSFGYLRTRKQADYKEWRENIMWPDNTQYWLRRTSRLNVTLLTLNQTELAVQRVQESSRSIQLFADTSSDCSSDTISESIFNESSNGLEYTSPNESNLLKGCIVNQDSVDWSLLRAWLQICEDSHGGECYPHELDIGLRVIYLTNLCLVYIDGGVEYAALSYVWGKREQLELREDNYKQLHSHNALADIKHMIPHTIKDAMTACSKLQIRYLWVDAMCIQQDSKEDKSKIIAYMDRIYAGAKLTLVAADSEDSWSGLHGVRPGTRIVQQFQEHIHNLQLGSTAQDLNSILQNSKWAKRGWTLQEKICSRRLLLFSKSQCLFWCNEAVFQEDAILEVNSRCHKIEMEQVRSGTDKYLRYDIEYRQDRRESDIPLSAYDNAVSDYMNRSFSFRDDASNAFLGVSKILQRLYGPLLFGMPEVAFGMCMSWHWMNAVSMEGATLPASLQLLDDVSNSERNLTYPSWTWMSWMHSCPFKSALFSPIRGEHYCRFTFYRFDETGTPIAISNHVFSTEEYLSDYYSLQDGPISAAERFQNYREEYRMPEIEIGIQSTSPELPPSSSTKTESLDSDSKATTNPHWRIVPLEPHPAFRLRILRPDSVPFSHLLGFWARSYQLFVDRNTIDDDAASCKAAPKDQLDPATINAFQSHLNPSHGTYQIRKQDNAKSIGQIVLRHGWRSKSSDCLQFVLIAADTKRADLLLLEWEYGVARRVGIVRGVKLDDLVEVRSELEMIILG